MELVGHGRNWSHMTYPGYESVLLTARDLVTPKLKLHDMVESREWPREGLHVGALVVNNVVVVKLKIIQACRPVKVLQSG